MSPEPSTSEILPVAAAGEVVAERSTLAETVVPFARDATLPAAGPKALGDYELLRVLGRGGMGTVFEARQRSLGRVVALKTVNSAEFASEEELSRFHSEAEAAARLDHPGIVPVYEVGQAEGRHYFSMALVAGPSLAQALRERTFTPQEAAGLIADLADAVDYAHRRGVIHRDLKPGNVLLDGMSPKITDFGLAKRIDASQQLTATGQVLGTPSFMSPEQAAGKSDVVTTSTDLYALGAILYVLLCGRPPFESESVWSTLHAVINDEPVPPASWPPPRRPTWRRSA